MSTWLNWVRATIPDMEEGRAIGCGQWWNFNLTAKEFKLKLYSWTLLSIGNSQNKSLFRDEIKMVRRCLSQSQRQKAIGEKKFTGKESHWDTRILGYSSILLTSETEPNTNVPNSSDWAGPPLQVDSGTRKAIRALRSGPKIVVEGVSQKLWHVLSFPPKME